MSLFWHSLRPLTQLDMARNHAQAMVMATFPARIVWDIAYSNRRVCATPLYN
jgi:hypothetical protein